MPSRLGREEEKELAAHMRDLERACEERLTEIESIAPILSLRGRRKERTRAKHVERLEAAVETMSRIRPRPKIYSEVAQLWRKAEEIRWRLAMGEYPIAIAEARRFAGRGLEIEDLKGEGLFGLIDAARRFDPDRGIRFSTYARWWVRARMTRAIDTKGAPIRLPSGFLEKVKKIEMVRAQARGASAADDPGKIAARLGMEEEEVRRVSETAISVRTISMSSPIRESDGSEGRTTLGDTLADERPDPEEIAMLSEARQILHNVIEALPPHHRLVVECYLHDGTTLQQAADRIEISRERVRQILLAVRRRLEGRATDVEGGEDEDGRGLRALPVPVPVPVPVPDLLPS